MSLTLWLISKNLPLGHYQRYEDEYKASPGMFIAENGDYWGEKKLRKVAGTIVNGLAQYKVAELIAREWDRFHSRLRLDIRDMCNGSQWRSGNVTKGVVYLDELLNGSVLRSQHNGPTERKVIVVDGKLVRTKQRINMAAAGAQRAHAAFSKPPHYHKMSPAEKRRVNQRFAAERRKDKKY